ncbi:hypothetical protein EW145_g5773 [Phellinidium pouzarii]|uniref:RRM domain-containing protein n=1 Tax=Phellinidium pouzarii TaxID=167371 RepID=A0A4S4KZG8_9AGAM|nr:hypothetical protein EW145_g5773 [Phellinidium pouzarii]
MSTLSETPSASTSNSHLSFPTHAIPEKSASPTPAAPAKELSKNRLYAFLQVFSKFGKIAKLDFLFHKTGPSRGKPRGYAFVEYKDKGDAMKALINANDKLFRGRKLVVTYANHAPAYEPSYTSGKHHRHGEMQRPTALSLIKSTTHTGRTEDRIAAFEAKLRQMEEASKQTPSTLPSHPSLPLKPPPSLSQPPVSASSETASTNSNRYRNQSNPSKTPNAKANGIFNSGSSSGLGKKPTLEELIKSRKAGTPGGLLKK